MEQARQPRRGPTVGRRRRPVRHAATRYVAFEAGDLKDLLNAEFIARHGKPDVLVLDPPRAGMHPSVVERIREMAPPCIVYVSCNPSTQARDLALLKDLYRITRVQPLDMFPHTWHVENVVRLERR